ncbi:MAG TPA: hypothetical protein VGB18_08810 [Candidatus Thermoplasmatota archaeon]
MPTSVKMRDADKDRLDRLQAQLVSRLGRRISQEVLLARLVALGEEQLDRLSATETRTTKEQIGRLLQLPVHTGLRTREEDLDMALYGREP